MGIARIDDIVNKLTAHGLPAETPVVIIESGTLPEQRYHLTTMSHLSATVKENHYASPSIIVIGDVVNLHNAVKIGLDNSASEIKYRQTLEIAQT